MRAMLAFGPLSLLAACNVAAATHGPVETRPFAVGAFDAVSLQGSDDVKIVTGATAGVVASGPRDVLDKLDIRIEGSTLKIGRKRESWSMGYSESPGVTITVTTPGIKAATLSGSGDMSIDRASGDAFKVSVAGSGNLDLADLRVGTADLSLAGSGDIKIAGAAKTASVSVAGSGDVDGARLMTETSDISVAGSGNTSLATSVRAKISVVGSGDVTVKGTGDCAISKVGSGEVRCER